MVGFDGLVIALRPAWRSRGGLLALSACGHLHLVLLGCQLLELGCQGPHALVGAGVLENDGWGEIDGFVDRFFVDGENPRVEVFLCTADAPGIESWSQIIAWEPPPKKPRRKRAPGKKDAGK